MAKKSVFRVLTAIALILTVNIGAEAQGLRPGSKNAALKLNETLITLVEGSSETITVSGLAAKEKVSWTTSNNAVATVDNGKITAVKAGTATITATVGSRKAKCNVTVTAKHDK